jgi:hypothetical protein
LHARRIWPFPSRPDALKKVRIINSKLTNLQSNTWTCFLILNAVQTSQTRGLNHLHLLCRGQIHTPALPIHPAITLLTYGNATFTVAL